VKAAQPKQTIKAETNTQALHASAPKQCVYEKLNVGEDQNQYVRLASEISDNDLDFLALAESENGRWDPKRKSNVVGVNGYSDFGLLQINRGWYLNIVTDKRFFTDIRWQIEQSYKLYKGGTKFWGAVNIPKNRAKFILKCK